MSSSRPFGPSPAAIAGLLGEPERLRVFAAVALGATTVEAVAATAGLESKAVVVALERLAGAGIVVQGEGGLVVAVERFKDAARAAAEEQRAADKAEEDFGDVADDDAAVLRNFVQRGRLVRIPAQRSKKMVVLDWLARRFEPGVRYPEAQVNLILGMVHADTAALRRYLVDEEFLERDDRERVYWRAGGTVEID